MAGKSYSRSIQFDHDGTTRALRFGTNAMASYQEAAGETFVAGVEQLQASAADFVRLRRLFWCGLGGAVTEAEAGDMMDDLGIAETADLIGRAVEAAFPKPDEGASGNGKGKGKAAA